VIFKLPPLSKPSVGPEIFFFQVKHIIGSGSILT